jgi:Uma2 family endonuclease
LGYNTLWEVDSMATKVRLTAEDLWTMPDVEGFCELVDGEIVEMSVPGPQHGGVVAELARRLGERAQALGAGRVVSHAGFRLELPRDPERVRAPDVAFVSASRLEGGKLPVKVIQGAPDLAVEVVSPSDGAAEVQQKVRDYLEAGSRLVWVLYPEARIASVYRPDGSARLLREGETLEGEDILPGLQVPLAELFD